jgi:hypothetical protein
MVEVMRPARKKLTSMVTAMVAARKAKRSVRETPKQRNILKMNRRTVEMAGPAMSFRDNFDLPKMSFTLTS